MIPSFNHDPSDDDFAPGVPFDGMVAENRAAGTIWVRALGVWAQVGAGGGGGGSAMFPVSFELEAPSATSGTGSALSGATSYVTPDGFCELACALPPTARVAGLFKILVLAPTFSAGTITVASIDMIVSTADGTESLHSLAGYGDTGVLTSGETYQPADFNGTPVSGTDLSTTDGLGITSADGGAYGVSVFLQVVASGLVA